MLKSFMKYSLFIFLSFIFVSCSSKISSMEERINNALDFATKNSLNKSILNSSNFNIFSLQSQNISCENKTLNIYIEGDGLAWISRSQVSQNPTPISQILLKLLSLDKNICKVYLARPCQYVETSKCKQEYWTNKRFNKEIIESFDEALNSLKTKYKNRDFNLIGYSGGGAVATLVASKRDDTKNIITIAGNLDIDKWVNIHNISKLEGSLNPANFTSNLENIKQFHIIGNDDKIVPKEVFLSYFSKFKNKKNIEYIYTNSNHSCCFETAFKEVLNQIEK